MRSAGIILLMAAVVGMGASCATHREAAVIGGVIGRTIGTPIGVAVVSAEEAAGTVGDIRRANPQRYERAKDVIHARRKKAHYIEVAENEAAQQFWR